MRKYELVASGDTSLSLPTAGPRAEFTSFLRDVSDAVCAGSGPSQVRMAYADVDEAFIHQMSPQKFGVFSETVFVLLCQNAGIDARRPLEIKRGRLVKTDRFDVLTDVFGRVEVKASRLSVKGRVQFGNMRPDDADTFVWQAHLPGQTRMWVVPSSVVPKLRGVQDSTGVSYGISRTSERRFGVSFKATDIPEWMAVYEVTDFRTLMSPWRRSVGR